MYNLTALAFDAYGTLFDVHSVVALAETLYPGRGQALSTAWRASQLQYTWLRSLMDRYEDFEKITADALLFACKSLGLDCDAGRRARLMDAYNHLRPFPEVPGALQALSGMPLAILSNGTPGMLRAAVESAGLQGRFAHLISVADTGIYKPSPTVYQLAVDRFRVVSRAEIGFVSSNAWDVAGATAFGFTTFWIHRGQGTPVMEELGVAPAAILTGLDQLPRLVNSTS